MKMKNISNSHWHHVLCMLVLLILPALACASTATPISNIAPTPDETMNALAPTATVPVPAWNPSETEWENIGGFLFGLPGGVNLGTKTFGIFSPGKKRGILHKAWDASRWYSTWNDLVKTCGKNTQPSVAGH